MKSALRWSLVAAGGALAVGALLLFAAPEAHGSKDAPPAPLPRVHLAAAEPVSTSLREEVTGSLEPSKRAQLGFEITGRLARIAVKKGQVVREGEVLAELTTDLADAQLEQAMAALASATAQADTARDVAERTGKLKAGGAASEQQMQLVNSSARSAEAQVAQARAQVAEMRAKRARHVLRAPFPGVVVDAPDQPGGTVLAGVTSLALEQLHPLTLRLTVPETARPQLVPGTRVRVSAVGSGASTDQATVSVVVPSADQATRRVPVELLVPNAEGRFTAHTLARATLHLGAEVSATQLPATALASVGGDHVWVVGADGALSRVPVQVLERGSKTVVVRSEQSLTQVVDAPAVDLAEGTRVQAH